MFHAPNSVNACTAWTGCSADHIKCLMSIFPHAQGIKHPAFPGHLSKSSRTLCLIRICADTPVALAARGASAAHPKGTGCTESYSASTGISGQVCQCIYSHGQHTPQLGDAGAAPSHAVSQSCSPVESWMGLFGVGHVAVRPNANKQQGLSTASHSCSLTPQACSITRNKKWGSSSPREARIEN